MTASFQTQSTLFSMEELVGVVRLIIQMESAIADNEDKKNKKNGKHHQKNKNGKNLNHHHKNNKRNKNGKKHKESPNIQRWISRRSKRDILFLLASISGVKMKIYCLTNNHHKNNNKHNKLNKTNNNNNKLNKFNITKHLIRDRVCRVSMDGKYLSMGEDCINLDKRLEISLGIDLCYNNVRLILKQLGLYDYYTQSHYNNFTDSSSYSSNPSYYSSSSSNTTMSDEFIKHARLNIKIDSNKLKYKHCITVHDPATSRTLILQLSNSSDRQMWAKGLCELKNMHQKTRNFRWTVVAYLISKYASTLNAHTQSNVSHTKGITKGVTKGLNALKLGLQSNKNKNKNNNQSYPQTMSNVPCYFEPFRQIINAINSGNANGFDRKYPKKFQKLYKRRQRRLKHHQTNYEKFGENDLIYDPNKIKANPPDEKDLYYE